MLVCNINILYAETELEKKLLGDWNVKYIIYIWQIKFELNSSQLQS